MVLSLNYVLCLALRAAQAKALIRRGAIWSNGRISTAACMAAAAFGMP